MFPGWLIDGVGAPPDQGVSSFLFVGAVLFGMVPVLRWRYRGFSGLPVWTTWASGAAAVSCLTLAFVLPPIIRPDAPATRPTTAARISFVSPSPGEVFHGHPARIPVRVDLEGARVVTYTSRDLVPDKGHIHLYLNHNLVSMTYGLRHVIHAPPGRYVLTAEFVALDHAPFNPRVVANVAVVVRG